MEDQHQYIAPAEEEVAQLGGNQHNFSGEEQQKGIFRPKTKKYPFCLLTLAD